VQIPAASRKGVSSESEPHATGRERRKGRTIEGRMTRDIQHPSITLDKDAVEYDCWVFNEDIL
jgi:hypothetical protein